MGKESYACIECGYECSKWMGRCTQCNSWNTLKKVESSTIVSRPNTSKAEVKKISVDTNNKEAERLSTKFSEFDRVLGGGIVPGEVVVMGGHPGVGKTTLLLQLLSNLIDEGHSCVYVSAEESLEQISLHAKRVGIKNQLDVICEDDIDSIIATLEEGKYDIAIIDSVQTVKTLDLKGLPGGIGQVRECASRITEIAKKKNVSAFLISHITKSGNLAGPKVLEHIVDAVFYLDSSSSYNIRLLRSLKNRFGTTSEIGVFDFSKKGFQDAKNPAEMFIKSNDPQIGVCKGVIFEGNRALLVEIQALVTNATFSMPQRIVRGVKKAKIQMLSALLSKYTKANLLEKDVYINIANGLVIDDSSLDLAICIAVLSSNFNKKIPPELVGIGEVSLTGQIYETPLLSEKVKAVGRLGYKKFILPQSASSLFKAKTGIQFIESVKLI